MTFCLFQRSGRCHFKAFGQMDEIDRPVDEIIITRMRRKGASAKREELVAQTTYSIGFHKACAFLAQKHTKED